jgi:transmembrane sensor
VSKLDGFLRRLGDEQDALRAEDDLSARVLRRFQYAAPQPRRHKLAWTALAAALAFLALLAGLATFRERRALSVGVGNAGGTPLVGAWLGAPDTSTLPLEFSDGSRFELAPQSRARVVELAPALARVELASGSLNVHVVPGRGVGWHIDAGPFGVRITGTRFVVSYAPEGDAFELSVTEGQVELSGCMLGSGRKVATGQRVRASCSKRTLDVSYPGVAASGSGPAAAPRASGALPALPPSEGPALAPPGDTEPPRPAPPSSAAAAEDWLALARSGKYAEAHAAVEREGFEAASSRASAEALTLLAEVERHARKPRRAEEALLTLRRRFAGSNDAALAAFTLGRLEFDERHAYSAASEWFRTYLKERPRGVMAREALGRLIEASHRAKDAAGARALAERYLREYPTGPHAELASRLVASP